MKVRTQLGIVFLVLVVLAAANAWTVHRQLDKLETTSVQQKAISRTWALIPRIRDLALEASAGDDAHRGALEVLVELVDATLDVLRSVEPRAQPVGQSDLRACQACHPNQELGEAVAGLAAWPAELDPQVIERFESSWSVFRALALDAQSVIFGPQELEKLARQEAALVRSLGEASSRLGSLQESVIAEVWLHALWLLAATVAALLAGFLLLGWRVQRPITRLLDASARLAAGDLTARVADRSRDELGELARSFNHMADSIAAGADSREQAAAAERRFIEVFEHASDGMILTDGQGLVCYFNAAAEQLFGYRKAEILGQSAEHLLPPEVLQRAQDALVQRLADGAIVGAVSFEAEGSRKDGGRFPARISVSVQQGPSGPTVLGIVCDLTEQHALRARTIELDRMIAVGTLVAGVAHEINNPLAFVMANVEFVQEGLDEVEGCLAGLRAALGQCEFPQEHAWLGWTALQQASTRLADLKLASVETHQGTARIRDIVLDLKRFSRAEEDRVGPVDLRSALEAAINMAYNEIKHRARLVKDYQASPRVMASEGRLAQVFLNLLLNAAQAIEPGDQADNVIRVTVGRSGGQVQVEIADTGCGIDPANLGRIFDPFFTTKPIGQGTGLGLGICRRIVEAFGGQIGVTSEPGRGSLVRVSLPEAEKLRLPDPAQPPAPALATPRGQVLVVDDEPQVGRALGRMIQPHHEVTVAASGAEALEKIRAGARFDVLLCDLMMPEMTGMALNAELGRLAPEQAARMVFMTGGAFSPEARAFLERTGCPVVSKPFDREALLGVVRGVLEVECLSGFDSRVSGR